MFVFLLTNAQQLDEEKNVVEWFGKCKTWWNNNEIDFSYVKGVGFFLFELFKKNLESICCPSYEMNAGSCKYEF